MLCTKQHAIVLNAAIEENACLLTHDSVFIKQASHSVEVIDCLKLNFNH